MHNYFSAMGIPVLRGRGFDPRDAPGAPSVVVINETMARPDVLRRGSGRQAHSVWHRRRRLDDDRRRHRRRAPRGLETPPAPEVYICYLQNPPVNPFLVVRTAADPAASRRAGSRRASALDKDIAAYDVRPMTQVRAESVSQRRFILLLVGAFGALALVMAAVGVYGVMALIVSERTPEIGIRLALGAHARTCSAPSSCRA